MYKSTFRSDQRRSKLTKRFIVDAATTRKAASKRVMKLTQKLDEAARRPGGRVVPSGPRLVKRSKNIPSN
jgi:hypothetical protein